MVLDRFINTHSFIIVIIVAVRMSQSSQKYSDYSIRPDMNKHIFFV